MSFEKRDPIEAAIFNSEVASDHDTMRMEGLALELVERQPAQVYKNFMQFFPDTGEAIGFDTQRLEHIGVSDSFAFMHITNDQTNVPYFTAGFAPNNELYGLDMYDAELSQIVDTCWTLMKDKSLDPDILLLLEYLSFLFAYDEDEALLPTMERLSEFSTVGDRQIADIIRGIVERNEGNKGIFIRQYNPSGEDDSTLIVLQHEPFGFNETEILEMKVPLLQISATDKGQTLVYSKSINGSGFEVYKAGKPEPIGEDFAETGFDEADEFIKRLWRQRPEPKYVQAMIDNLEEAKMYESELATGHRVYPELPFGFEVEKFLSPDMTTDIPAAFEEIIRSINYACEYDLPPGFEKPPKFSAISNRLEHVNKFLGQKVKSPDGKLKARSDIFDVDKACQEILDEISQYNHPVAQAIAFLSNDYGDILGRADIRRITTEVVKQTQTRRLRQHYLELSDDWRNGVAALVSLAA